MYMHIDTPATASRRARMRFGRARLMLQMHRLKFADADNPVCTNCTSGANESTEHVLQDCSKYNTERGTCAATLRAVLGRRASCMRDASQFHAIVIDPQGSVPRLHLSRVLNITGKFIDAVVRLRGC
jgi:hypothetical protein